MDTQGKRSGQGLTSAKKESAEAEEGGHLVFLRHSRLRPVPGTKWVSRTTGRDETRGTAGCIWPKA